MPEIVVKKTRYSTITVKTYTEKDQLEPSPLMKKLEEKVMEEKKVRQRQLPCIYFPSMERKQSES